MGELLLGMALAVNTIFAVTACMMDAFSEAHRIMFPVKEDEGKKRWREDVYDAWKR